MKPLLEKIFSSEIIFSKFSIQNLFDLYSIAVRCELDDTKLSELKASIEEYLKIKEVSLQKLAKALALKDIEIPQKTYESAIRILRNDIVEPFVLGELKASLKDASCENK